MSFEEQLSKDKYPSIFSHQMEAIVFIALQMFFTTRGGFEIWVISLGYSPFSAEEYSVVMRENI